MKSLLTLAIALVLQINLCHAGPETKPKADPLTSVGIVIVFDTSSSMDDNTINAWGDRESRFSVAKRALKTIVEKIDVYAKDHTVQVSLMTFSGTPIPLRAWNKPALDKWLAETKNPGGNTPLGITILAAANQLKTAELAHKHVVALTDGQSNTGIEPSVAITKIQNNDATRLTKTHIVAFDINAREFNGVKTLGVTVLPASGATLDTGLTTLFGEKILLEEPDER